ncbi:MAG TPA: hypothetical protein VIM80_00225 [Brevefilum sp.]
MKKSILFTSLFILVALLAACSQTPEAVVTETAILTIGSEEFSLSELEAYEALSADYTNKDGETSTYEGVALIDLLEDANLTDGDTLVFKASDGYEAEMPLAEALSCANCIVAFDEDILRMVMPDMSSKLQVKDVIKISVK